MSESLTASGGCHAVMQSCSPAVLSERSGDHNRQVVTVLRSIELIINNITLLPIAFCLLDNHKSSENTDGGNNRILYLDAITSPYAPAERIATRSPRRVSGSEMDLPKVSVVSQIGPTTVYFFSLRSEYRFSIR